MCKKLFSMFLSFVLLFSVNVYANESDLNLLENNVLLEKDDFSSQEEYEVYLEEHPDVEPQQYTEIPELQSMA